MKEYNQVHNRGMSFEQWLAAQCKILSDNVRTLQEENTSLISYINELEDTLGLRNRSNPNLTLSGDEFNCPACFKFLSECECDEIKQEHAKNFGGI